MAARKRKARDTPPPPGNKNQRPIVFSFQYYDISRSDYCLSKLTSQQIHNALARLREISEKTVVELQADHRVFHFHEVDWSKTCEPDGFKNDRADAITAFQFSLLNVNQQKARVYGALAEGTFYLVWIDLNHSIWPSLKRNT